MTMMPDTIDKEVKNINEKEMEFYNGGDGVEWEVWINKKTNKEYVVPIQIQRFFEDSEELNNQEW